MIRIVTAYTLEYSGYADVLVDSARRFSVPISAFAFNSRGSWAADCAIKPEAVIEAMETGDDCLWLDADMELASWPTEWPAGDVLLHYDDHPAATVYDFEKGRVIPNSEGIRTPWCGLALYRNVPIVRDVLLPQWRDILREHHASVGDEQCFRLAMERTPGLTVGPLGTRFMRHAVAGYAHGKPAQYEQWLGPQPNGVI